MAKRSPSDIKRFRRAITALAVNYKREADEALLTAYEWGTADISVAAIEQACARAMRECEFMPVAAKLRELAGEMIPATRAAIAWEAVEKAVFTHGSGPSLDFDDKAINATVNNLGGWEVICEHEGEQFRVWMRKRFEEVYVRLLKAGITTEQARPCVGFHQRNNQMFGPRMKDFLEQTKLNPRIIGAAPIPIATGLPSVPLIPRRVDPKIQAGAMPKVEFKKP